VVHCLKNLGLIQGVLLACARGLDLGPFFDAFRVRNQGEGSAQYGEQGKRSKALKGFDPSAQGIAGGDRWHHALDLVWPGF
jgi:hypothetical protein